MSSEKEIPAYTVALAAHGDVVRDPTLFISTLCSFHTSRGSKFLIPVIGGKELNLHLLYVEVTGRGGYDQVVREKKWREISCVFELSPTTTSASYALRKHYHALLLPFEYLVFFNRHPQSLQETSFQATGTIHGKFECGYIVSIKIGDETLNGVLYHPGSSSTSQSCKAIVPYNRIHHQTGGRRTKKKKRTGDHSHPKPNRSGYNFFFAEKHAKLKSEFPKWEREFTKMIATSWNGLSPQEKAVYKEYGVKDKERYQREMKEYKEKQRERQQQSSSEAS